MLHSDDTFPFLSQAFRVAVSHPCFDHVIANLISLKVLVSICEVKPLPIANRLNRVQTLFRQSILKTIVIVIVNYQICVVHL